MFPVTLTCKCIKCNRYIGELTDSRWFCWSCGTGLVMKGYSWDFLKNSVSITFEPATALEVFEVRICPPSP